MTMQPAFNTGFIPIFPVPTESKRNSRTLRYDRAPDTQALSDTNVLGVGLKGSAVHYVQDQLNALGAAPPLKEDGKYGPKTEQAVKAFQRSRGLPATGKVDRRTLEALQSAGLTELREGLGLLSADLQQEVLARMESARNAPEKQLAVAALATSQGFGQLSPAHQRQALEALDQTKGPTHTRNAGMAMGQMTSSQEFLAVDDSVKTAALEEMKNASTSHLPTAAMDVAAERLAAITARP